MVWIWRSLTGTPPLIFPGLSLIQRRQPPNLWVVASAKGDDGGWMRDFWHRLWLPQEHPGSSPLGLNSGCTAEGSLFWPQELLLCYHREGHSRKSQTLSFVFSIVQGCMPLILWEPGRFFVFLCIWNAPFWLYVFFFFLTKQTYGKRAHALSHFDLSQCIAPLGAQKQGPHPWNAEKKTSF